MNKKTMLSFVLGCLVTSLLMSFFLDRYKANEREKLYEGATSVKVIVAAMDLNKGTLLSPERLVIKSVYKSAVGSYVIYPEDFLTIKDKCLKFPLKKGEPVLSVYVEQEGEPVLSAYVEQEGEPVN